MIKLATWKLDTSLHVKFTKEVLGYEPKVRVEKLSAAAVMMLSAHAGPINSYAVNVYSFRRVFLWPRDGMAELALATAAMVCGCVPWFAAC